MESHFMKLPTNSSCSDVASRGSLELGSECCKWLQTICALQHAAVPFCELVRPPTLYIYTHHFFTFQFYEYF
jgi:hypothetical protein